MSEDVTREQGIASAALSIIDVWKLRILYSNILTGALSRVVGDGVMEYDS